MTREINQGDRKGKRQEWRTSRALAKVIADRYSIDLDAMATPSDTIVPRFIAPPRPIFNAPPHCWWRVPPPECRAYEGGKSDSVDRDKATETENATWRDLRVGGSLATCVAVDALGVSWAKHGTSIFVNPPFAVLGKVVAKAIQASKDGARVVMLAPDNGDTRWFAALADAGAVVLRFRGRVSYESADAAIGESGPGFPSALYVLDERAIPRAAGDAVPTFAVDPATLGLL